MLLSIAVLDLIGKITISYPALILLLIAAPYIYRTQLIFLLSTYKIKRIGPVDLEQKTNNDHTILQHPKDVLFNFFNMFFVLRTKLILHLLYQKNSLNYKQFLSYAEEIGVLANNMEATLEAIISSGCATHDNETITITSLGKEYVAYLNRLTGYPSQKH